MEIIIGIEDTGLTVKPLMTGRMPGAFRQDCRFSIDEIAGTDGHMAHVAVADDNHCYEKECSALCGMLADIIIENLQIRHMVRLLKLEYDFLSEKEQCDVLVRALKKLWYGSPGQQNEVAACKNEIRQRLYETFRDNESDTIVLEGFMRFRMKDYLDAWEKELQICVAEYLRKKEYAEFVEILRLFIKIRIPRARKVHVCVGGDGEYVLLDERYCLLKYRFTQTDADRDDALLSALVNIAPLSIVVHNKDRFFDARILETIIDIFGRRVEFTEDIN